MEDSLRESLNQIQTHKENLQKHPLNPLECYSQFQNGMQIPFRMGAEQQVELYSWIPNNDSRHIILPPEEPHLLSHRDVECSASSSFASYSGCFGPGRSPEISNCGQEKGYLHELSRTADLKPQLGWQFSYLPYNVNYLSDPKFQLTTEMDRPENPMDYQVNRSFEPPRPAYDANNHNWTSTSGPCAENLFDDRLYPQQQN